jgi:hypothetical protein
MAVDSRVFTWARSGLDRLRKRGAFDSAQSLWQGARPDAARLLDFRTRHTHQVLDFGSAGFRRAM